MLITKNAPRMNAPSTTWTSRFMLEGLKTMAQKSVMTAAAARPDRDDDPRRRLHPGVGDDDPDGGEDAAQRDHEGGEEVHPLADAVPAEDQHGQEAGLEEEGEDALGGQGAAEDVADVAGVGGPVGAELELHDDAGGDAHREVDGEDARPELGHLVIDDVAGAQVHPLHDHHDHAQPDGQRREE